jgi:hypothetical protein
LQLNRQAPPNFFPVEREYHSTGIKFRPWAGDLLFHTHPQCDGCHAVGGVTPQGIISESSFDGSRIKGFILNQVASRIQRFKQLAASGIDLPAARMAFIRPD